MRRSLAPSQNRSVKLRPSCDFTPPLQNQRKRSCQEKSHLNETGRARPVPLSQYEQAIAKILSQPFKVPIANYIPDYNGGNRCLGMRRSNVRKSLHDPFACNALVLYVPPNYTEHERMTLNPTQIQVHVVVDPLLSNILRPHQREGVRFMYECVEGYRGSFNGCIMADEMGLGKTLQCVTLVWTLLRQGPYCKPIISKAIIVSPSSLVKNWEKEFNKWLQGRLHCVAIEGGAKEDTIRSLEQFVVDSGQRCGAPVLLISYETFRIYSYILCRNEMGMVICDEGHRLKNSDNLTYQALMGLKTKRRVLLSGTPIQNDLTEYFSLVNFVNPEMLGTAVDFKRNFENAILRGQNADSTDKERERAVKKTKELIGLVNQCIIRRTNQILTKYLPVKFEMVICTKLTEMQMQLYTNFIKSDKVRRSLADCNEKTTLTALADITTLKKLCSHPDLIYEKVLAREIGFEKSSHVFPANYNPKEFSPELSGKFMLLDFMLASIRANSDDRVVLISNYTQTLELLEKLARKRRYTYVRLDGSMTIKKRSKVVDKFNDPESDCFLFMLSSKAGGCGLNLIGANRLFMFDPDWNPANDEQAMARVWRDGQKKPCYIYRLVAPVLEQELRINQGASLYFCDTFGVCISNLKDGIGIFDHYFHFGPTILKLPVSDDYRYKRLIAIPRKEPNDSGFTRPRDVSVRLVMTTKTTFSQSLVAYKTGSIEEKILQRQTHKKSLSSAIIDNNESDEKHFTRDDLKDLFRFEADVLSDTHVKLKCKRCVNNIQMQPPPDDSDCTTHLSQWYHCSNNKGLPDSTLSQAWLTSKCISFVFHHRSQVEVKEDKFREDEKENMQEKKDSKKNKKRRQSDEDEEDDVSNYDPDDSADSDYT